MPRRNLGEPGDGSPAILKRHLYKHHERRGDPRRSSDACLLLFALLQDDDHVLPLNGRPIQ
jgi:hypothetical protein